MACVSAAVHVPRCGVPEVVRQLEISRSMTQDILHTARRGQGKEANATFAKDSVPGCFDVRKQLRAGRVLFSAYLARAPVWIRLRTGRTGHLKCRVKNVTHGQFRRPKCPTRHLGIAPVRACVQVMHRMRASGVSIPSLPLAFLSPSLSAAVFAACATRPAHRFRRKDMHGAHATAVLGSTRRALLPV